MGDPRSGAPLYRPDTGTAPFLSYHQHVAIRIDPAPPRLLNRELSWLEYMTRVLEIAEDDTLPLLERVKFAAILAQHLDEFFMVRVAGLLELDEAGLGVRSVDGLTPSQALVAIRESVVELTGRQARLWRRELRPSLAAAGIEIARIEDCTDKELRRLQAYFEREIFPVLTPLAVGPGQSFPYISGLSLSLGVLASDPETGEERFARVKVPEGFDRFVSVGKRLVPLEAVLAHFLPMLFPGMEISERALFRVTRDADFEVSDDADDLLEAVESELRRRRFGDAVRLEVSASASRALRERLVEGLGVRAGHVYDVEGLLDQADLWQLAGLDRPELKHDPWAPVVPPRWARAKTPERIFEEVKRGDLFVHHPYESFRASFEAFAQAAALDRDVIAIKTTVYRTSDESALISSLIECAEEGKQSVCLVELKARFDERRNIEWSRAMEQAGVHVVHGFADVKIHAKMTLIVRREPEGLRRYVHIGTGNYNASTARLYEDVGLFTADEEIAADVADLFNYVTGFGRPQRFRKLIVAPFTMRSRIVEEIRRVSTAAEEGQKTRIRLKTNALVDPTIVEELYAAAAVGVPIEILARSICMLRPGVEGLSETIRVRSIVGRFLEHSRIYSFEAGDTASIYFGSGDLMPRNLDRRIEVLAPVEGARARAEVNAILDSAFSDTTNAWELGQDGVWTRVSGKEKNGHSHQAAMMRRAQLRARRARS
jgi:polyphosphate kinase